MGLKGHLIWRHTRQSGRIEEACSAKWLPSPLVHRIQVPPRSASDLLLTAQPAALGAVRRPSLVLWSMHEPILHQACEALLRCMRFSCRFSARQSTAVDKYHARPASILSICRSFQMAQITVRKSLRNTDRRTRDRQQCWQSFFQSG